MKRLFCQNVIIPHAANLYLCNFYGYNNIDSILFNNITFMFTGPGVFDLSVCVEDQLDFMCVSTGLTRNDFIDWNVTIIQDSGGRLSDTRLISAVSTSDIRPITLNMINFNINSTKTEAANGSISLTTFISVENVTALLNGAEIACFELKDLPGGELLIVQVAKAVIYVITLESSKFINLYIISQAWTHL